VVADADAAARAVDVVVVADAPVAAVAEDAKAVQITNDRPLATAAFFFAYRQSSFRRIESTP
jgi:hypothetical protein